ncbi:hypothetical protein IQ268_13745 [Oculatella sp. LEGE 06141]|uniref:hypothetical protein n=1 Tax=Oculatella sp. LEGE 06141 TaxID=1828648 RepID=UPI00187E0253|nr:hypothetical protein [Oculatella sp. LEGE 06141]MBE9179626.1 hypothetical protein [Oculatella sp. LEGE 06141]
MARKRLSDLVREEAQKVPEAEAAQPEPDAEHTPASESDDSDDSDRDDQASSEESTASRSTSSRSKSPTKAELEAIVTDLQAEIRAAQKERDELHHKLSELQEALETEKALHQKLQAELKKADQLKVELEKARDLILKLSEANAKPAQPAASSAPPAALSLSKPEASKPKSEPSKLPQLTKSTSGQVSTGQDSQSALRKVLRHPIEPTTLPHMPSEYDTKLSNDDIGWVD